MDEDIQIVTEKLNNIIDDAGIAIKFSDKERSTSVLVDAIRQAITSVRAKKSQEDAKAKEDVAQIAESTKKAEGSLQDLNDNFEGLQDTVEQLEEGEEKRFIATYAQWQRIGEAVADVALNIAEMSYDATKQKLSWLQELEKSGIRLAGGFDESFTQLANDAKMSHDAFVKMLTSNSKQITKMNALGSETMNSMMEASGNLVGKFGYSVDDASKIMLYYMDTIGSVNTAEQLRNRNITTEVENLGKQMKSLSLATGKSIEMLLQEQEQRRKNLLMEKIYRDPTMGQLLSTGINAGIDEDVLLAAITGRPNEKSSQMNITAGGRALNRALQQAAIAIRSGKMGKDDIIPYLADIQKDSRIVNDVQQIEQMSYGKAGAINNTALGDNLFSLSQFMRAGLNVNATNKVGSGSAEENAMNSLSNLDAAQNKLLNTHIDKMALSLETTTNALDIFSKALEKAQSIANMTPDWLYMLGAGIISSALTSNVGSLFVTKLADFFTRGGLKAGFNLVKSKLVTMSSGISKIGGQLMGHGAKLGLGLSALSVAIGGAVVIFEDTFTNWLSKTFNWEKGGWQWKTSKILTNAVGGAIIGFPLGGPIGAIAGALAGAAWGTYEAFFSDEAKSYSNKTPTTYEQMYPAYNKYNTVNNTQIKTTQEKQQANNEQTNTYLKEIYEVNKKTANNTSTMPKDYENKRLSSTGTIVQSYA